MSVSLIVITRDVGFRLAACLAAVNAHAPPADELILVLDAPDHVGLPQYTFGWKQPLPRLVRGRAMGRAAARNDGARVASCDGLVFLDGDMLTAPDFLAGHREALKASGGFVRGRVRELLGAAICADLEAGGHDFPALSLCDLADRGFSAEPYRTAANTLEQAVEARFINGDQNIPQWLASAGANFTVRRDIWFDLGGQDERFGLHWGCEDLEFSYRICKRLGAVVFAADAAGYHLSHRQPNRWLEHERTLAIFHALHPDRAVGALRHLLSNGGSLQRYQAALAEAHAL
jgi:GT2 family glycosyltransferase